MTKMQQKTLEGNLLKLQNELVAMKFKASYDGSISIDDDIQDMKGRIN